MRYQQLAGAVALMRGVPRFTPALWQRLFWDAGLARCTVHLFLRDDAHPGSPWAMVVDTGGGLIDLEAFSVPGPPSRLAEVSAEGALLDEARAHQARIEVFAVEGRCPKGSAHELVARAAAAALRTTSAIAWLQPAAGILLPAADSARRVRETRAGEFPVDLWVTLRSAVHAPTAIVDTFGLATFDAPDVELEVDVEDEPQARAFLLTLASELSCGRRVLREGVPIPGPLGLQWSGVLATSRQAPLRAVLRLRIAG